MTTIVYPMARASGCDAGCASGCDAGCDADWRRPQPLTSSSDGSFEAFRVSRASSSVFSCFLTLRWGQGCGGVGLVKRTSQCTKEGEEEEKSRCDGRGNVRVSLSCERLFNLPEPMVNVLSAETRCNAARGSG